MFTFIETRTFSQLLPRYLSDDEYALLQRHLRTAPESGSMVPGSGGVRKLRWARAGTGKRGGLRINAQLRDGTIWMLTIYAKSQEPNIPAHVLRRIREQIDG